MAENERQDPWADRLPQTYDADETLNSMLEDFGYPEGFVPEWAEDELGMDPNE